VTDPDRWTSRHAAEMYALDQWGADYFDVSEGGTLLVTPRGTAPDAPRADLLEIVRGLEARDLMTPVVLRFDDILAHRMGHLRSAFDAAVAEAEYSGRYRCVYPIKVNQQRHLCEVIRDLGAELDFGLEAGSKPELLAGLALTEGMQSMPLVCNGFKDAEFIETVLLAAKMGRNIVPVIEQTHELELLAQLAAEHQQLPRFGIRAKLASGGAGRWAGSVGFRGKFGLSVSQILASIEFVRERGLLDGLRMLHCHIGSQIYDIRTLKTAISEMTQLYVQMIRAGAPMDTIDFGGGLGIDYDGSASATDSSINYTLEQYASEIVYRVKSICDDAEVPHPDLITESGRALVAHSGVLVFQVVGSRVFPEQPDRTLIDRAIEADDEDVPQPLLDLVEAWRSLEAGGDPGEVFLDAEYALGEVIGLFNLGYADLVARAACEDLYWAIAHRVAKVDPLLLPEELHDLKERVGDLYFSNFSLFQSLIDSWAIGQVFPVMPIHRLDERPTRRGTLVDITCDSDGKLDRFPLADEVAHSLPLHELRRGGNGGPAGELEPYYLAVFLTGAYQETLGDLHNLFGDTHAVHVRMDAAGEWALEEVVEGETVRDVLGYVQYRPDEMRRTLRREIELAVKERRLSLEEGVSMRRFLDDGIAGYTYLE